MGEAASFQWRWRVSPSPTTLEIYNPLSTPCEMSPDTGHVTVTFVQESRS